MTFGDLGLKASALGAWLQESGLAGKRILLIYPPSLEYIVAFFGCIFAGAVPVPAYPPRMNQSLRRLHLIAKDAEVAVALTTRQILSKVERFIGLEPGFEAIRFIATDEVSDDLANQYSDPKVTADTVAFLQYTSGSTAYPKGVMVSHANILHNENMIQEAFHQSENSVIVNWLPLYHDMGLIGNVIQSLSIGARCIVLSPSTFIQDPFRWLHAISQYKATTSGGPDFAYSLCVQKIGLEQRAVLDLSSWSVAFNGSEPVRENTLRRFAESFKPCGFNPEVFSTCYGLAESTLFVSGGFRGKAPSVKAVDAKALEINRVVEISQEDANARKIVSCGAPLSDTRIEIVDPQTLTRCALNHVGEIWVSGPSVALGYLNKSEETEKTFGAFISDTGEGAFLRTGDLGFIEDGELFVTGRLKDLIIIRGLNYYPEDIELTVECCHVDLSKGRGAAFSVEISGEQRLAVLHEVARHPKCEPESLIEIIRRSVTQNHGLAPYAIVLLKRGAIPRTSSGKVQRHVCRDLFIEGSLEPVAQWRELLRATEEGSSARSINPAQTQEEAEYWLADQISRRLEIDLSRIDIDAPLSAYGIDSLLATELTHAIENCFGMNFPVTEFLEDATIVQIADELLARSTRLSALSPPPIPISAQRATEYPLSKGQEALWLLQQLAPSSPVYIISGAARITGDLDITVLRHSFQSLVDRHPCLRTTFSPRHGEPAQLVNDRMKVSLLEEDAADCSNEDFEKRLADFVHLPFDLERDSLLRVGVFRRSAGEHIVALAAHHLVMDFWSFAILIRELQAFYTAIKESKPAGLLPLDTKYADYVFWQAAQLGDDKSELMWKHWQEQLSSGLPAINLPTDSIRPPVYSYRGGTKSISINRALTAALNLSAANDATLFMTLLAAFQVLIYRYADQEDFVIGSPTSAGAVLIWRA